MGTRTYSRRGVDGTRVLTRLGRERQQPITSLIDYENTLALKKVNELAKRIQDTGRVEVKSTNRAGVFVDKLRDFSSAEVDILMNYQITPESTVTPSPFGGYNYDIYQTPTRLVLKDFMQLEGMNYTEAWKKIEQDIAERNRLEESSREIDATISPLVERIKQVTTLQNMNQEMKPIADLMNQVALDVARNPRMNIQQVIQERVRQLPERFQSLSPTQIQRLTRLTSEFIQHRIDSTPEPRAIKEGFSDKSPYNFHKDLLNRARAVNKPYLIPWTEFVADIYGVL